MGQNAKDTSKINIHGHHLYGAEGYPQLMFVTQNGILIAQSLHFEFHKKVRKPLEITPYTFLSFLKKLRADEQYLITCLQNVIQEFKQTSCFGAHTCCLHPITGEKSYKFQKTGMLGNKSNNLFIVPCSIMMDVINFGLREVTTKLNVQIQNPPVLPQTNVHDPIISSADYDQVMEDLNNLYAAGIPSHLSTLGKLKGLSNSYERFQRD
jgi:hypothetical protein